MSHRVAQGLLIAFALLATFSLLAPLPLAADNPDFAKLVEPLADEIIQNRRHLHKHPELSLREFETQKWLRTKLAEIPGVELIDGAWGTGVVAILTGKEPEPLVAYCTDMDALPITESTGLSYASTKTDVIRGRDVGVMHACGHDIHMAVLVGTAIFDPDEQGKGEKGVKSCPVPSPPDGLFC